MESGRSSSEFYYDHLWLKKYSWSQSDLQFENLQENKKPKILFLAQLHPTLCSPIDVTCQAPLSMGFPRQEFWSEDAISYSRGSSQPRDRTQVSCISCIGRQNFYPQHHLGSLPFPSSQSYCIQCMQPSINSTNDGDVWKS